MNVNEHWASAEQTSKTPVHEGFCGRMDAGTEVQACCYGTGKRAFGPASPKRYMLYYMQYDMVYKLLVTILC